MRPHKVWVRVLYLQPEGMTDDLIAAIRDTPEVLALPSTSPCSTARARPAPHGRSGDEREFSRLFARLRAEIPGMVLRSTAMAGFPGETDEDFERLMAFLAEEELDYCSVFAYSREEGTRAAEMDDQVDEDVKLERTQALVDLTEQIGFAATAAHVGERARVIIDGVEEGATVRSSWDTPGSRRPTPTAPSTFPSGRRAWATSSTSTSSTLSAMSSWASSQRRRAKCHPRTASGPPPTS